MTTLTTLTAWGLKSSVLLALAALTALAFRRSSAATRHLIWAAGTIAVLLLPLASAVGPAWRLAVPDAAKWLMAVDREPRVTAAPEPSASDASDAPPPAYQKEASANPTPAGVTVTTTRDRGIAASVPGMLVAAWLAGAAVVLLALVCSLAATFRLGRRARPVEGDIAATASQLLRRFGIRRPVRVVLSREARMPMTWGAHRPVVSLPADAATWPRQRLEAVLAHELAHVARWDWVTQLAARLACALNWMNPLVWFAARRMREERELACDDHVLALGTPAPDYANDLLEIARALRADRITALAGIAMARPSKLAGRLLAVLDGSRTRGPVTRRRTAAASVATATLLVPVAALQLAQRASQHVPTARPLVAVATLTSPVSLDAVQAQNPNATLCDWRRQADRSTSSSNVNDDRVTITLELDDCSLDIRARGKVTFATDDRDVEQLDPDGYFLIEERAPNGERRRAEVERIRGQLTRRWYVNGAERSWERDAGEWFHGALLVMFRRTSFGAEERAARIYRTRGAEAVLTEADQIHSGSALTHYYRLVAERERLRPEQIQRMVAGSERITSSSALGQVLTALLANPGADDAARAGIVGGSQRISSSSERRKVLVAAAERGPLSPTLAEAVSRSAAGISSSSERAAVLVKVGEQMPADQPLPGAYLEAAESISSGSEKARVLTGLLRRDRLDSVQLASVFNLAATISSSSSRAEVLTTALERHRLAGTARDAFFQATNGLSSTSERSRVLLAVLGAEPDPATVRGVLESAGGISSSSARASVLVAAARGGYVSTDELRMVYRRAAEGISSRSERERALAALAGRAI